ncbi:MULTISPECIES: ABC transporter substrate-binding protein [Halorussus]|uniref:ABC transporter substrate-binding protein n=1 Tax=Halorussus TaxID=1070314 RepID=UPI00209ED8A2|nr:ABC transporter substrate-binding protein [Halorussus vallis]USZ77727.1 ABC transporter substrate-binding protein [Halorussus vallis]
MDDSVSRRRWLTALGATGAAGLAGCMGSDESGQNTTTDGGTTGDDSGMTETTAKTSKQSNVSGKVKIGVLQPTSGDLKYYGQQALWGFYSGLAYKNGGDPIKKATTGTHTATVGDVEYELVVRDTKFKADTAQSLATDLVQNEEVDLLFGCTSSGSANRVIKTVVKQAQVPIMVGPAASADITSSSETCGNLVFRASENTAMDARSGGKYVARESDVSKVYLFGADYSFGKAVVNNYEQVLKDEGVEIVGKKFVPQGYSEWKGLLDNAQKAGAEGIVGGFTVATLPKLFTSYLNGNYDYRVFGGFATRITNAIVGQTLQKALGKPLTKEKLRNSKLGPFTTRYHWNQYDNEINSAFVDSYTKTYGTVPDLFTSGTFTAASAIVQAVQQSGSTKGADIAEALRGMTVADTPKGKNGYTFQKYNNQARSAMTVANPVPTTDQWADSWKAAIMPSKPLSTIPADQATIPKSGVNCSL